MSQTDNAYWEKVVKLHAYVKGRMIQAEELDPKLNTFSPAVNEQRSALDHILRAKAAEVGIKPGVDLKYQQIQLDKALGHLYRAYFDVADWLAICIRDRVVKVLKRYSAECIKAAIPEYYRTFRTSLEEIPLAIAELRNRKDIGGSDLLAEVDHYEEQLDKLVFILKEIF